MRQYIDTAQDLAGNALALATCKVLNYPSGSNASIFSDNGLTPIGSSTVAADVTGQFSFFAADGDYTLQLLNNGTLYKTQSPVSLFDGTPQLTYADTGAASAYAIANSTLEKALRIGLRASFLAANTSTGASTFQYNGLAVKGLTYPGGGPTGAATIIAGGIYPVEYDGVSWQLRDAAAVTAYYPTTATETAAGVSVVNFSYPPLTVDRYGTNTTPGTTSMVAAFTATVKVAQQASGTVRYGATAPYLLDSPVNCTFATAANQYGVLIQGPAFGLDHPVFGLIARHTGVAIFDCTGNDAITFSDVAMTTDAVTYPQTGILWARNNAGQDSQMNKLFRCAIDGSFSVAPFYNYGSEDDELTNCLFVNRATTAGTKTRVYTGQNVSNLVSPFVTIRPNTTAVSCTDHNDFGCQDYNLGGTATSDCIYLEQADTFKKYGGWGWSASASGNGRALVYVDMSTNASNNCVLDGLTGEQSTFLQNYGLLFSNNAFIPLGWAVNDCKLTNAIAGISAGALVTVDTFKLQGTSFPAGGGGIAIPGTLRNSQSFDFGGGVPVTIGTSTNNRLTGATENLTITTRNKDFWIDTGVLNKTIATVTTSAGITSSAGALIARARLSLNGPCLTFNIVLASTSGNLAIGANSTITLTSPGGQSFAPLDIGACAVVDATAGTLNGATVSSSGSSALITIPVAVVATPHSIIVSGTVFLA